MEKMMRSIVFGLAAGLLVAVLAALASSLGVPGDAGAMAGVFALMVGVALLHHWKTQHFQAMREGFQQVTHKLGLLHDHVSEAQGLVQLSRFNDAYPLPFGGGWALTADAAAVLVREIALNRPRTIVELGSGVSTQLIGRMLKEAGEGKLYSLDHEAGWADQTRRHVQTSGLGDYVEVLDAPLTMQRFNGQEYNWYQLPEQVRKLENIDLIVIDGPPQSLAPNGTPRFPALPAFIAQLSPKAMLYIDDAKRPQEQEMIAMWLKEFPQFESRMHDTAPGTCLLKRSP
jgi:predicted O-methyltransferase YrrM